jgi:hypothetical protein
MNKLHRRDWGLSEKTINTFPTNIGRDGKSEPHQQHHGGSITIVGEWIPKRV